MKKIFDLQKGMTQAISHYSRFDDAACTKTGTKYNYTGTTRISAEDKIKRFYNFVIASLIIAAIIIFVATWSQTIAPTAPSDGRSSETTTTRSTVKEEKPMVEKNEQVPANKGNKDPSPDVTK